MRVFWTLILVLTVAAAAIALLTRDPNPGLPVDPDAGARAMAPARASTPASGAPSPATPSTIADERDAEASRAASESNADSTTSTPPTDDPAAALVAELDAERSARAANDQTAGEAAAAMTSATEGEPLTLGMELEIENTTIEAGRILRRADGGLAIDDRFVVVGDGTAARPYEVTWEYLFSASERYQPRLGELAIPQRIAMLDGAFVRISGYLAFPLLVGSTNECLVMLNQWDGCCIGVPPTPYDAIEVRLNEATSTGAKHSSPFGTITGRLRVDPYIVKDWLVGLYVMDGADLDTDL